MRPVGTTFRRRAWVVLLAGLLAACAPPPSPTATATTSAAPAASRGPARALHFMAATANRYASEAAREILRAGGSAVDAAVAAQLVLNLVEPQSSGIGGGAFLLHYAAETGEIAAYDGRETAPEAASETMFLRADGSPKGFHEAAVGGLAVGVPGVLRMLEAAHAAYGRLPWARLFEPAIALAEEGFAVSPRLYNYLAREKYLKASPAAAAYFYDPAGVPWAVGTRLRNPAFAATLRAIAAGGADAFYRGPIARDIVRAIQGARGNPGRMMASDLAAYQAKRRSPVCAPYRTWLLCGMPPPSSGGITVLQILGILENFDLAALTPNSAEAVHLVAEASRLAFADRNAYIGDSDFVAVPTGRMLDPDYLGRRAALISPDRSMGRAAPGLGTAAAANGGAGAEGLSTTSLAIVDAAGNAVAMTSSIETVFGSRVMVRGFLLNNQLTDFSFRPQRDGRPVANRVQPRKRPRSSMAPTLVFDNAGRFVMAVGSPGGARIIAYVVKTVLAALDWKLDIQAAVAWPNFANLNGATDLEAGTPLEAIAGRLEALGHEVKLRPLGSGLHAVMVTPAGIEGAADPRREGVALGD